MTNNNKDLATKKVLPVDGERKGNWPTASCRVSPDELNLIDAAAYRTRKKRSELLHEALMAHVRQILQAA